MSYQPAWIKGREATSGERECAKRYELVRDFCSQYKRPFTIFDFGAAQCYFGLRLTEDFPDCTVAAAEYDEAKSALLILQQNKSDRIILLHHRFTLDDLRQLSDAEHFDVVLALSVIHHLDGEFAERLSILKSLGDNLILEFAHENTACGGEQKLYKIPPTARLMGYGDSHLEAGERRQIVNVSEMKTSIAKSYIGSPREDLALTIYSDFQAKRVHFYHKPEARDWHRGINLQTYLQFGGIHPSKTWILELLDARRRELAKHTDAVPWNVILQGDAVQCIDGDDPNMTVDLGPGAVDRLFEAVGG